MLHKTKRLNLEPTTFGTTGPPPQSDMFMKKWLDLVHDSCRCANFSSRHDYENKLSHQFIPHRWAELLFGVKLLKTQTRDIWQRQGGGGCYVLQIIWWQQSGVGCHLQIERWHVIFVKVTLKIIKNLYSYIKRFKHQETVQRRKLPGRYVFCFKQTLKLTKSDGSLFTVLTWIRVPLSSLFSSVVSTFLRNAVKLECSCTVK